jgi:hypothetical protein
MWVDLQLVGKKVRGLSMIITKRAGFMGFGKEEFWIIRI